MTDPLPDVLPWSLIGSPRDQRLYLFTLVLLVLGTVLAGMALRMTRLDVPGVAVASAGAAGWLLSNGSGEGRTLVEVLPGNGLTTADLAVVPTAVLVAALCWRRLHRGQSQGRREPDVRVVSAQ